MADAPHAVIVTTLPMLRSASRAANGLLGACGWTATILVADDFFGVASDPRSSVHGSAWFAARLSPGELARLAMLHRADALVRSLRPHALRSILQERGGTVVSIPDDAEITGRIDCITDAAATHGLAVVATRTTPLPLDGRLPDSVDFDRLGRFDQELLAVTARQESFLDAWIASLVRAPHVTAERFDPVARPWLDELAPLFAAAVVRDVTISTSYRNADEPGRERSLLLRFPGFDPARPWQLSEMAGEIPRVMLSAFPWFRERCAVRAAALSGPAVRSPFAELSNGVVIDEVMRGAYAVALRRAEANGSPSPPNPFSGDGASDVLSWLAAPPSSSQHTNRYLHALHSSRPDLQQRFPDVEAVAYRSWATINGRESDVVPELLPAADLEPRAADNSGPTAGATVRTRRDGLNIVGLLRAELGVGEAARQLLRAVNASGLDHAVLVDEATVHRQALSGPSGSDDPEFAVTVVARNADALPVVLQRLGLESADTPYTVGLWFWEVERFPDRLRGGLDAVDEVWVATEHVRDAIASATAKPVRLIPLPLPLPVATRTDDVASVAFGRDVRDRFVVMFSFDYASVAERKNPWGVVDAYIRAFPREGAALPDGRVPLLMVKSISEDHFAMERKRLVNAIGTRRDIVLREGFLDADVNRSLLAGADCYVSLHRAEGWGLTLAEAMVAGVPCVATDYSGNLSFMNDSNSWLVPCTLVPIPDTVREYAGCGRWAEPDIDAAAHAIRGIALDPDAARARALHGREDAIRLSDPSAAAEFLCARTKEILDMLIAARITPVTDPTPEQEPAVTELVSPQSDPLDDHPGLGPVVLSPPPSPDPAPDGIRGSVRGQVERAIRYETENRDRRDHQRAVELVAALSETRRAVRDLTIHQRADQETLTTAIAATGSHVDAIQHGHDALHSAVTDIGRTVHDDHVLLADVRDRLHLIESRLDRLTAAIESLASRAAGDTA